MIGWQPIETAPKDGAPILAASYEADCDGVFCWRMTTVKWRVWGGYWALCEAGAYAEDDEWSPSHWQPLPAPPDGPA